MLKHFTFGYPCHIPSMRMHTVFRKDMLVIYLVHVKPPRDASANGQGIPDAEAQSGPLGARATRIRMELSFCQ